jgi:DNA-binding XRE family transcriptional regulator
MEFTRLIRANLRISQRRFGEIVGIPSWRISAIETGRPMKGEELAKVLNAMGKSVFYEVDPKIRLRIPSKKNRRGVDES